MPTDKSLAQVADEALREAHDHLAQFCKGYPNCPCREIRKQYKRAVLAARLDEHMRTAMPGVDCPRCVWLREELERLANGR